MRKAEHSSRMTCATNLFQSGTEEKIIRDRTGHKSDAFFSHEHPSEKQLQKESSALGPVNSTSYESSPSDNLPLGGISLFADNGGNGNAEWYDSEVLNELLAGFDISESETNRCSSAFNGGVSDDILSQIVLPEPSCVNVIGGKYF